MGSSDADVERANALFFDELVPAIVPMIIADIGALCRILLGSGLREGAREIQKR